MRTRMTLSVYGIANISCREYRRKKKYACKFFKPLLIIFKNLENYKQDLDEIIEFSLDNLNNNGIGNTNKYAFRKLLNGYKQFDPTRGAFYILDLLLLDNNLGIELHKRVNVMRPLGTVEIIPMPYVTESSKINLVVIFTVDYNFKEIQDFFQSFEQFILDIKEIAEKINLFVIYVKQTEQTEINLKEDRKRCIHINETLKELSKKYSSIIKTSSRIFFSELNITGTLYNSESYRLLAVADYLNKRLTADDLILIVSPCVEMQTEFLNRVRLNTVKGHQVFFPIPFNEYTPNIVYSIRPYPDEIEINKNYGYFNIYSYEFVSFYNSDYSHVKAKYLEEYSILNSNTTSNLLLTDLYQLFSIDKKINLLRATDQSLKCRSHLIDNCTLRQGDNNEIQRCLKQRETSLGTKAQLAMHLMKHYDNLINNN